MTMQVETDLRDVTDTGGTDETKKPSQLFLRNLPLAMLEPDIESMLADCGPIKRVDLIKTIDKVTGEKQSRGFGFVTFALEADAAKAVESINGKRVMGRVISCEIALKKGAKREVAGRGPKQPAVQVTRKSRTSEGGEAVASYGGGKTSGDGTRLPKNEESKEAGRRVTSSTLAAKGPGSTSGEAKSGHEGQKSGKIVKGSLKSTTAAGAGASSPERDEAAAADEGQRETGGEPGSGLSKKEARKAARKEMKKELKRKAKERAKERKEVQAREGATDATEGTDADAGAEVGTGDGDAEDLDPAVLKLKQDARTVLIFGVADDLMPKQLQKRIKKLATIESVTLEENEKGFFPSGRIARVRCASKEGTRKVITGIDRHKVHERMLVARRLLELVPGDDARRRKQQRLIVRNLSFHAKEADLVEAFCAFGPLAEVHIPTVMVNVRRRIRGTDDEELVTEEKSRGFGFVQYLCPKDAARVVKDHGVMDLCEREVAVDYAVTKEKYHSMRQGGAEEGTGKEALPDAGEGAEDVESDGGVGKDDDDGEAEEEDGIPEGVDGSDHGRGENAASDEDDADEDEDEDGLGDEDDNEEEDEEGGPDAGAGIGVEDRRRKKKRPSDVHEGCTVFVRNVAFDCGEPDVRKRFEEFGKVRLALLVKDHKTGMPRGTAFVKFSTKEEADQCLAAAIGAKDVSHARDSGGSCVYLGDRALHITRAVDREQAGRLTVGAQKRVKHKDKRNLYLADEGLVVEDSAAAEGAAKGDLEKRVQARRDKKTKLKNPMFFVSPVRLSVRNLARHVTDGKLKALVCAASKAGLEAGRSTSQDVRRYLEAQSFVEIAQAEEFAAITPGRLQIPAVTTASVVKSKIIRDMDKKVDDDDPSSLHPSRGYGFVEFAHHGHALAALRQMNNNPAYSWAAKSDGASKGETSRLIVEFSVENHAKLKLQQTRKEAFDKRKRDLQALGLGQDGRPLKKREETLRRSRGKVQRDKRRHDPLSGESAGGGSVEDVKSGVPEKRKGGGVKRARDDRSDAAAAREALGDAEIAKLPSSRGKSKRHKKGNSYEHMDRQELAYQRLEREYKTKINGGASGGEVGSRSKKRGGKETVETRGRGDGKASSGASMSPTKKERRGRWFD